jgi:ABC-type antimicrobial peptide transport system permease subunit
MQHLVLPAITMSVIPMGIIARTVRALVADILAQEFIVGLRAKGLTDLGIFLHVVKNAAPTALAVMGLQLGYLLGGSILIETVFSWPGAGFLLNSAIFQRDLPLLQGTILVLAMFFVVLNLVVDVIQTRSIRASPDEHAQRDPHLDERHRHQPRCRRWPSSAAPATGRPWAGGSLRDPVALVAGA